MRDVAVVTGGGRGIGRACALALAARGVDVAVASRTKHEVEEATAALRKLGVRAEGFLCDVSNERDVAEMAKGVHSSLGVPTFVVNNAGALRSAQLHEMAESDWDTVIGANLKGAFLVTRAFLPGMLKNRRGRVIAVGSISGTLGTAGLSAYCASKWGLTGMMKSLAEELRGTGVQAISVLPGSVDTAMLKGSKYKPDMSPEDVANLVVYAALDAPSAMNGSAIEIFGP